MEANTNTPKPKRTRRTTEESVTVDTKIWLLEFVKSTGAPIAMICFMLFAGYQGFIWFGNHVFLPYIAKQIQSMELLDKSQERIVENQTKVAEALTSLNKDMEMTKNVVSVNSEVLRKQDEKLAEAVTVLKNIERELKK